MRCYWLCLLLLVPCSWSQELKVLVDNDGFHEWTWDISSSSDLENTYKIPPRSIHSSIWKFVSSIDIKMTQSNGAFWFEGRVTKDELTGHDCTTPTNFKYSRQPFPIRVEICNNTIRLIPVGTIVNICIDNQTPDEWMLWNVVQGDTLQNQTVDGGSRRCHSVQQYYSDYFNITLYRVNYPWAKVVFPGYSQYDQPPCRLPYFFYYTIDQVFEATYCNATITLITRTRTIPEPDAFCIENRSLQRLFHHFSSHHGNFSLSFPEGFSPSWMSSQVRKCYRILGNHNSNTIFNVNATYESDVVKGQFMQASQAPSECTLPGKLVHTWENPPVEWYQCGNMLTVIQTNHTFCIENASPDLWTVRGTLEEPADKWYTGRDPASVIASKTLEAQSKSCFVLNKRHNGDEPFGLILERLDGKRLILRVQHVGPQNVETWGASKLWINSNWEKEIPYQLELHNNTLVLDSAFDRKVNVCFDNQFYKTWTIAIVFDFCDSEWGIRQNPQRVLLNKKIVEETRMCYSLNQRHPNASFMVRMKQDSSEEWFEARMSIKATENDDKCSKPENLKYSSEGFPIEAILCTNTLTLLPVLRDGASASCTHKVSSCKLYWETVGVIDNRYNDEEVERSYESTIGLTSGTTKGFSAEQRSHTNTAQQSETSSHRRTNSRVGTENEQNEERRESSGSSHHLGGSVTSTPGVNAWFVKYSVTKADNYDNTNETRQEKANGSRTSQRKDHSNEKMEGSSRSQTNESGREQMVAINEVLSKEIIWSKTQKDTIKAGPGKLKKWKQRVLTCECFGYRLPLWRVELVANGPVLRSGSSRRRRAHHHHTRSLHHGPKHHCNKEGTFRPISQRCDRHEECYHGRWVIRENPPGKAMVADGSFALSSHVDGC